MGPLDFALSQFAALKIDASKDKTKERVSDSSRSSATLGNCTNTKDWNPGKVWLCRGMKRSLYPNLLTAFLILANNHTVLLSRQ